MSQVFPERITQARERLGMSKTELADKVGVSPAAVAQWESGTKFPTAENMLTLSRILETGIPLLLAPYPHELNRKGPVTFRAWGAANTRRANRAAERSAELVAEVYLWLDNHVSLPSVSLPEIPFSDDLDFAATECRRAWGLGDRPILKLGELLESKGIVLAKACFGDSRFDAFSCVIDGRPFIFLGTEKGNHARSRFDAAHELGHLILHQHLTEADLRKPGVLKSIEQEANRFAGAFLLPEDTFKRDFSSPSLEGFLKLKAKWGVSVQAMVVRSRQLKLITDEHYQELYRQIGVKGWRSAHGEPLDEVVPQTKGAIGRKSLEALEAHSIINGWEIPSELPMPPSIFLNVFERNLSELEPNEISKIIPLKSFL